MQFYTLAAGTVSLVEGALGRLKEYPGRSTDDLFLFTGDPPARTKPLRRDEGPFRFNGGDAAPRRPACA